jgi:hypothetical protein
MKVKKFEIPSHFGLHARTQQRNWGVYIYIYIYIYISFKLMKLVTRKPRKLVFCPIRIFLAKLEKAFHHRRAFLVNFVM